MAQEKRGNAFGWNVINNVYFKSILTVLNQIISDNHQNRIVADAGKKVMSSDWENTEPPILSRANNEYINFEKVRLGEEHRTLYFKEFRGERKIRWGKKIKLIPSHCCTKMNQHNEIVVVKDGVVCSIWPITVRGPYR